MADRRSWPRLELGPRSRRRPVPGQREAKAREAEELRCQRSRLSQQQISGWLEHVLPAALRVSGGSISSQRSFRLCSTTTCWCGTSAGEPARDRCLDEASDGTEGGWSRLRRGFAGEAPPGAYDRLVCADVTRFRGSGDADLAICQAVLEHVNDTSAALRALASIVRPGGKVAIFVPCRNALFARLNLALPETTKRRMLFTLFPVRKEVHSGYPAVYHRCTPRLMSTDAGAAGLQLERLDVYWHSTYLSAFAPAWAAWRLWTLIMWAKGSREMCETFSLVLSRRNYCRLLRELMYFAF